MEMDPWKEPRVSIDVLTLKGGAMARSMLDQLGRERVGKFLTALREGHTGANYTREDVLASSPSAYAASTSHTTRASSGPPADA